MTHPGVIVVRGDEPGRKLVLDEVLSDFTLGADDGCHLVFKLRRVSPIHAFPGRAGRSRKQMGR